MQDEYQDTNLQQLELVCLLTGSNERSQLRAPPPPMQPPPPPGVAAERGSTGGPGDMAPLGVTVVGDDDQS